MGRAMMDHGFFGTIDMDTAEFHGFPFVPKPAQGAEFIWSLRQMQATQPFVPGNTILLPDDFDQSGISMEDVGILHQLGAIAVYGPIAMPILTQSNWAALSALQTLRTKAATAISLLLNSAYFYVEAAARPEYCEVMLYPLAVTSMQEAHLLFMSAVLNEAACIRR